MQKNFWTEGNKIMSCDYLIKTDLKRKFKNTQNQIIVGSELADNFYNYDFMISNKDKAIQFVVDYADELMKCLEAYKKSTGKMFDLSNPLKAVNLIALVKAREVLAECDYIKDHWDEEIVLDEDNVSVILHDLKQMTREELLEKVFITKETLNQVSADYLSDFIPSLSGDRKRLNNVIGNMEGPDLSERTVKSIMINSYDEVAKIASCTDIDTSSIHSFVRDVVVAYSEETLTKQFDLENRIVIVDDVVDKFHKEPTEYLDPNNRIYVKHEKERDSMSQSKQQEGREQ